MSSELDIDLVEVLCESAQDGAEASALARMIQVQLALPQTSRFKIVVYLSMVFGIPLSRATAIGAWVGFGDEDGHISDEEVDRLFAEDLRKWRGR